MDTKNQSSDENFVLSKQLGIAADLCFSVPDHVGYLADCLLVHDSIVVPLSHQTLNRLEAAFDSPPLFELIKTRKSPSVKMPFTIRAKARIALHSIESAILLKCVQGIYSKTVVTGPRFLQK